MPQNEAYNEKRKLFQSKLAKELEATRETSLLAQYLCNVPYRVARETLYSPDDLFEAYDPSDPTSLERCFDKRVLRHVQETGLTADDPFEVAARMFHDYAVGGAMKRLLAGFERTKVVGIMGGHSLSRTSASYRKAADVSRRLTELGYFMISGGGPGAMEATHLGAWMAGRSEAEVDEAVAMLGRAPTFSDAGWFDAAYAVTRRFPLTSGARSLAVPTWYYGEEPPTVLATDIAKFFSNSLREEILLSESYGGLIFMEGGAGTIEEVFQKVVQNHYLTLGIAAPLVFVGRSFWTAEVPIIPFLRHMMANGRYRHLTVHLVDETDDIVKAIMK